MSVSRVGFKQVEAARGDYRMVAWLPVKKLRVGSSAPRGYTVTVVYPTTHYQCQEPGCGKLCSPEVSRCLCEKK